MFAFESLAARGGPLLWSFTGDARTYVDYGIPSLHGLFNAIVLLVGTLGCLMLVLRKHSRLALIALAFALAVPIFELSRQVSLSLAAQCYVLLASLSRAGEGFSCSVLLSHFPSRNSPSSARFGRRPMCLSRNHDRAKPQQRQGARHD